MEAGRSNDSYNYGVLVLSETVQPFLPKPPAKKRIGRPKGSKNKPKVPVGDAVSPPPPPPTPVPALKHFILEIPQSYDVVQSIISFARSREHAAVTVVSASGVVTNVVLQNDVALSPGFLLHGAYRLMSLSGHVICLTKGTYSWSFSATLSDSNRQVIGGVVTTSTVASSLVVVVLSICENPSVVRLPGQWRTVGSSLLDGR